MRVHTIILKSCCLSAVNWVLSVFFFASDKKIRSLLILILITSNTFRYHEILRNQNLL